MTGCTAHHVTLSQVGNVQTVSHGHLLMINRVLDVTRYLRNLEGVYYTGLAAVYWLCGKEPNPVRQINIKAHRGVRTAAEKLLWLSGLPKKTKQHNEASHVQEQERVESDVFMKYDRLTVISFSINAMWLRKIKTAMQWSPTCLVWCSLTSLLVQTPLHQPHLSCVLFRF